MHGTLPKLPAKPPATLRASTRERRKSVTRRSVTHIALPGCEIARVTPRSRETITALLKRTGWARRDAQYGWRFCNGLPTILMVNGEFVLRKRWRHTRIGAADVVQFVSRPLGGQGGQSTGKQVIGLVALIAVVAFAAYAGPLIATSAWGFGLAAGSNAALAVGAGITAAIGISGSLLINALTAPKAGATNDPNAKTDQIYTASATGNLPKLGQPLPVGYGREKRFPDFAATPWGEFVGNDQYQNILLSVGLGRYDYEQLFIDDTPLWDPVDGVAAAFSSAQIEFYDPGEAVTLFPTSVVSSSEVTGQQLPHGTGTGGTTPGGGSTTPGDWLGGYIVNGAGTVAQSLAVDFVFPAGCFVTSGSETRALSVGLRAEYRTVNGAGAPTGPWLELFDVNRNYASRSPIRDSIKVDVADGRYEVRFRRNDGVPDSSVGASDVIWAGLRAFLKGNNTFPVSTIAIRIKGTESTQGSFKFGALRTRILPVWDAESATFIDQPTRNPGWVFLDALSNEEYGSGHPLSKADFNAIIAFAVGCDARGDHFDYTFDSAVAVPAAFDTILTPARARHFWLGDTVSIVRDEWRDVPTMLLTDREIVRDTTQISFSMLGDEDPDAVILEYIDEDTWRPAQVQYPPEVDGGFHASNAETKRIDGIVNRDHAYREAAFYYLQSIYRRENVQIATEYEGRAITQGAVVRVQSELPMAYGYGGAVVDRSGNSLTLDPAPSWADEGSHYIRLRRPNGKCFGPVLVTRGASDAIAELNSGSLATAVSTQGISLSEVLERAPGGDDPSFDFGAGDNQSRLCVVLSGQPNGSQCTLNLVVDDPRVHATDLGSPPILPTAQFPADLKAPVIIGLNANFGQGVIEPKLSASWFPATGAFDYVAEVSYDDGANWIQVYEGRDNKFDAVVTLAALTLRVQAVGKLHGPYSQISLEAPTIQWLGDPIGLGSLTPALRDLVTTTFNDDLRRIQQTLDFIAGFVADQDATNRVERMNARQTLDYREQVVVSKVDGVAGDVSDLNDTVVTLSGTVDTVASIASSNTSVLSTLQTSVTAQFGAITARVTTNETAIASNSSALATYSTSTDAALGSLSARTSTVETSYASLNGSFSSFSTSVSASLGSLSASVTTNSTAVASINGKLAASYSVALNVNGYASGFKNINDGTFSAFVVMADAFLVAFPAAGAGGVAQTVFDISNVNGAARMVLRGDFYADGAIYARMMTAESVTAENGAIKNLSVQSLKLGDNAVTVPIFAADSSGISVTSPNTSNLITISFTIDTTGLSGKVINVLFQGNCQLTAGTNNFCNMFLYADRTGSGGETLLQTASSLIVGVPISLMGILGFIANGGVMTVSARVALQVFGPPGTTITVANRVLTAMAVKR